MNEHFRVAHKLGLMFRPDEALPRDIKSWAIKQLRAPSPVLGTETVHSEIKPWPKSLQPNLEDRAAMMRLHWENTKKRRQKIKGYDTEAARQANDRDNRMHKKRHAQVCPPKCLWVRSSSSEACLFLDQSLYNGWF